MNVIMAPKAPGLRPFSHPLRSFWSLWSWFWFSPMPEIRLGLLRIWLFGFAFFDVLLRNEYVQSPASIPDLFWRPIGIVWLLERVGIGPPSASAFVAIQVAVAALAVFAAIGYRYRLTGLGAALGYLYWQSLGHSWGEMKHARVTLVLALFFLAASSAARARSIDSLRSRVTRARRLLKIPERAAGQSSAAAWPIRAIQVALAALYFLSGYSKIRSQKGLGWIWTDTLFQAIEDKATTGQATELGLFVSRFPPLLTVIQGFTLLWELAFPLAFLRYLRLPILLGGLAFNVGLWTTVRIEFFGVVACFASFFYLERIEERARVYFERWRKSRSRLVVYYNGECSQCVGTMSWVQACDWGRKVDFLDVLPVGAHSSSAVDPITVKRDGAVMRGYEGLVILAKEIPILWPLRWLLVLPVARSFGRRAFSRAQSRHSHGHAGPGRLVEAPDQRERAGRV